MMNVELLDELASAFHTAANSLQFKMEAHPLGGEVFASRYDDPKAEIFRAIGDVYRATAAKLRESVVRP